MSSFDQKMSAIVNSAMGRPAIPSPKKRANEIFQHTIRHYNYLKTQLKPDQSINLVCYLGNTIFDVYQVSATEHFYEITSQDADGTVHFVTAPVEQIAFDIIIAKKVNDEPPRKIGFEVNKSQNNP